jgi:hypothetical protein
LVEILTNQSVKNSRKNVLAIVSWNHDTGNNV